MLIWFLLLFAAAALLAAVRSRARLRASAGVLAVLMAVTLSGCGSAPPSEPAEEDGFLLYECAGGLTAAIPSADADALNISIGDGSDDTLLTVAEKASQDAARADGLELPESMGWLFSLVRSDQAGFEQSVVGDYPGLYWFARDNKWYYGLAQPTDVRFYRSGNDYPPEDLAAWDHLNTLAPMVQADFLTRNGIAPYSISTLYNGYTYESEHLFYLYAPAEMPDSALLLVLSQPARQGEGGIWCVERVQWVQGFGSTLWFPQSELSAADFFAQVQEEHDAGRRSDYADPMSAMSTFFQEFGFTDPVPTPADLEQVEPLPELLPLMEALRPEDIMAVHSRQSLSPDVLSDAIRAAAAGLREDLKALPESDPVLWSASVFLEGSPDAYMSSRDLHLVLDCGAKKDLVEVTLARGFQHTAAVLEDPVLYDLIRSSQDGPEGIVQEDYALFRETIEDLMDETLALYNQPKRLYKSCELVSFSPVLEYDEDPDGRVQAVLYDVDFALVPEDYTDVEWYGGMYLDSELRVRGVNAQGQLAVRYRLGEIAATAFLGNDWLYAPGSDPEQAAAHVTAALDASEQSAGLPVRIDYITPELTDRFGESWDTFIDKDAGDAPVQALLFTDRTVRNFRIFTVVPNPGDGMTFTEGEILLTNSKLLPEEPMMLELSFPGDMPTRGIAFTVDGVEHACAIGMSGKDGSLLLIPMDQL